MTRLVLACFLWVPLSATGFLSARALGAPHVIGSYEWQGGSRGPRHYTRCTYLGPSGAIVERPLDGRCGWVRFGQERR